MDLVYDLPSGKRAMRCKSYTNPCPIAKTETKLRTVTWTTESIELNTSNFNIKLILSQIIQLHNLKFSSEVKLFYCVFYFKFEKLVLIREPILVASCLEFYQHVLLRFESFSYWHCVWLQHLWRFMRHLPVSNGNQQPKVN